MYNNMQNLTNYNNRVYYKDGITCVSSQGALFNKIFQDNISTYNSLLSTIKTWSDDKNKIVIRKDK